MENIYESVEYSLIRLFYLDKKAKRSDNYYMKHINEGLEILKQVYTANIDAQKAFCLHPLIQADDDFVRNISVLYRVPNISVKAIIFAMEYRSVANAFLPRNLNTANPYLSPIDEVNIMLKADKIQNYLDFNQNREKYLNEVQLDLYFKEWFSVLKIPSAEAYSRYIN